MSIGMAAITYDPEYDRADRLLQYAQSWGAKPSARHRILRTVGDFSTLSDYFSLGVNFSASGIVNRHQLEAFVLDQRGRIAHVVARRRWDEAELLQLAAPLLTLPSPQPDLRARVDAAEPGVVSAPDQAVLPDAAPAV